MRKILNILLIFFVLAWGSSVFADPPRRTLDTENMPSTTYQDDTALIFGTDEDFHFEYNPTTELWQWSDGTNIFFTLKDKGTTGIFDFYDEIDLHRTAGSGAGILYHGLGIEMQVGALNAASEIHGINFTAVGDTNGLVSAIGTNGPISPIHQHVGTLGNVGWGSIYTASAHTDKTSAFNTSGAPSATLTNAVNDYFLIADAGTFEQISIELLTLASLDQWLTFEYGDGSQAWVEFTPFDGTDGLTMDGLITWHADDLTSWGTDTVNEITGKSGSADLYWIKITRTRPGNPTDPIEKHIQILSPVTYEWDASGALDIYSISTSRYAWIEEFDDEVSGVEWESGLQADFWTTAGTNYASGNVTYTAGPGGTLQVKNAAAEDDSVTIIGAPNFREALNPVFEARIKIDDITTVHWAVGLVEGSYSSNGTYDDDIVLIGQDTDEAAANIYLITNDTAGGVEFTDSGIDAVNGAYIKVKFDATDPEDIRLWINGTEIDISGANIQAATTLMPYIMVQNLAGGSIQRTLTVDYIKIWQDRG